MHHAASESRRPHVSLAPIVALLVGAGCDAPPMAPDLPPDVAPLLSKEPDGRTPNRENAGVRGTPQYQATAEFHRLVPGPEALRQWDAEVVVTEMRGRQPGANLWFRYSVRDEEGLFYTDLWPCEAAPCPLDSSAPVPIDPADIAIHPGLHRATLDTEVAVFDGESGTQGSVHLRVVWERETTRGPSKHVTASLTIDVTGGFFPHVEDLSSAALVDAELTRSTPSEPS